MRPLTTEQLLRLRSTVAGNFTSTATIRRPTSAKNPRGGADTSYSSVATGVLCRVVANAGEAERESGGQLKAFSSYKVYFPAGTDIKPKDQLVIGTTTLEVVEAFDSASTQLALMVSAIRVRA